MSSKEKKKPASKMLDNLILGDFPPITQEILKSKVESNVDTKEIFLEEDEIKTMSTELLPFIKDLLIRVEEESKKFELDAIICLESMIKFTDLMINCLPEGADTIPESLIQIIVSFNKHLRANFVDFKVKDAISALCEKCCQKRWQLSGSFISETLNFLFVRTLDEKRNPTSKDLKRVTNLQEVIFRLNVDGNVFEQLSGQLLSTVESSTYLQCKEGQQFISFLLTLDLKFTKKVHEAIKFFLPDASKIQAEALGKIYHSAWLNSAAEQRQMIEKQCIQDYMSNVFVLHRSHSSMEMSQLGKNVLYILSVFHKSRKQIHLSKAITELYSPLIWRNLRSGSNIIRCNAAEVFLDVYPLEKPGVGRADQVMFLQRQHDEMADLLTDKCHVVRIIAVKGICHCLKNFWETFSAGSIKVLMETMVNEMIHDGSSSDVRKSVFQGFTKMLKNPNSAAYLAKVLPSLQNHIHDENEKVRQAFVDMLLQIKELPESFPLQYWKIVPAEHLAARLALENEDVGKRLVKLIMSEIYTPDKPLSAVLKRIYKIILMNHQGARRLFAHSKKVLPLDGAVSIMLNILVVMNKRFKEIEENNLENARREHSINKRKKRSKSNVLRDNNHCDDHNSSLDSTSSSGISESSSSNDSSLSVQKENIAQEPHQLDNPDVCRVFIDIVIILWTINSSALNEPSNKTLLDNLQTIASNCMPLYLRYFKGSKVFYTVIHFASLIPLPKLTSLTTISSMCVSHLKNLNEFCKKEETEVYVNALCSWNRAPEILELATDWLDQAFRSERLNQSAALRTSVRRKVKFQHCEAKPLLALKLIDIIFEYELNRTKVMKNYNAVYELFLFLEKIKVLIERRVAMGAPFPDASLSDIFLQDCLYRYSKLMLILHKPNDDDDDNSEATSDVSSVATNTLHVDASYAFPGLVDWAVRILIPKIPEDLDYENEDIPISINLLRIIVRSGSLMMACNLTSNFTTLHFINFLNLLLDSGSKLCFVYDAFIAFKELVENSEAHYERDEEKLLRVKLPSLLSNIVDVLLDRKVTKDVLASFITNLAEMKRCILSLPLALIRNFGIKSQTLHLLVASFSKICISIIADDIEEERTFETIDKYQNLPGSSFFIVGALLSRESVCKLWFNILSEVVSSIPKDSTHLLAMVSLLHTLSSVKNPKLKELLTKAVKKTYEVINALPDVDSNKSTIDSSFNASGQQVLNAKKLGIPVLTEIAKRIGFVLV